MTKMVTVSTRIPQAISDLLPESGVHGRRALWVRNAIEEKLKAEGKIDDSLLCTGAEPKAAAT